MPGRLSPPSSLVGHCRFYLWRKIQARLIKRLLLDDESLRLTAITGANEHFFASLLISLSNPLFCGRLTLLSIA